jgi:RNA polymerase sigma-70 factor (ECF subfamily)
VTFDASKSRSDAGDRRSSEPLLERARAGDPQAFDELVRREQSRVVGVLGRLLTDPRDVEEATQDTFLQAWRHLDAFRGDAEVSTWLYRIATNQALMRLRRRRPRLAHLDDAAARLPDGAPPVDDHVTRRLGGLSPLVAALQRLPPTQRIVVVLRDIEGLSNIQIADVLELPLPTVKARLHRGRMALRRHVDRDPTWSASEEP